MLLYYPFWMFMGFTLHFYIIFGTNLLTGGPARIAAFFCLFQCFEEKEYQTESKWNETFRSDLFGTNAIQGTWSGRQVTNKEATRVPGAPLGGGRAPHHRGPLEHQPAYFFLIYMSTYHENIQEHHEKLFPPPQPSVSARSHLGAFAGAPSEGESATEGLYISILAPPMSCE